MRYGWGEPPKAAESLKSHGIATWWRESRTAKLQPQITLANGFLLIEVRAGFRE
jgi:hypothetical protein